MDSIRAEIDAGPRIKAGVSEVLDEGQEVVVLFSVLNPANHAIEILPPQVQLGGKVKKKWTTAEQLHVIDFRLSTRRLGAGQRADGVVVFERPSFKESNETLFLQIADSGAVDLPALAPIGFGIRIDYGRQFHGNILEMLRVIVHALHVNFADAFGTCWKSNSVAN